MKVFYFNPQDGYSDDENGTIKVLHNLSRVYEALPIKNRRIMDHGGFCWNGFEKNRFTSTGH
ncbi:hypothetical protein [Larkinella arboricola]|uniref:hypothetical protein n=1 Tax=Larkinella arboricola TaxID=643671 RepID=UPI0011BAB6EC|nr:hypothetical protein [Larkinella arboricola]